MAPSILSGRIVKIRKSKKSGTTHQRNHRWESFTTKISKLNSLDAVRRVRRHDIGPEDLSTTTSYFKAGLEKWAELSVSQNFIAFSHEVLPLSDSLPQILHFEEKIMGILITYLEKKERDIIQPLLELMTDFAHDLGARFEKHYAKALEIVTALAETAQDEDVIEWSFTCLAFLFKYLSKLLVPDLRPTYDLMAPLMGKDRVPPHIARFAAEAISFLVKKAAAPAHRQTALPLIISHTKNDLRSIAGTRQSGLYYHGIMTMFAEAMKGNGLNVYTGAPAIIHSLFIGLDSSDFEKGSQWTNVIYGVLTSLVHHTSSDSFKDMEKTVLEFSNHVAESFTADSILLNLQQLLFSARTIGIIAGVRKGSRVSNWQGILGEFSSILRAISKNAQVFNFDCADMDIWEQLVLSIAIAMQYAPMDAMIPFIPVFMDTLTKEPLAKYFLTFCAYFSEAAEGSDRFHIILLPYFKRFVLAHWSDADNGDTLCILLPKLVSSGILHNNHGKKGFALPQSWQDQIVSKFEGLEVKPFPEQVSAALYDPDPKKWVDRCLPKYNALLDVLECTTVHPSTNARIAEILLRKLKLALRPDFSAAPEEAHFIVGRGFSAVLKMSSGYGSVDGSLRPLLHAKVSDYGRLPDFLQGLLTYEKSAPISELKSTHREGASPFENGQECLIKPLISNLSTNSPALRLLSLRLLEHFYNIDHQSVSEALSLMITVEQTPLDLQTARSASMHIRRLAVVYSQEVTQSWIRQAIPSFCFGMFTVRFAQIWDDAAATLTRVSESTDGEKLVAELAFKWLEQLSWRPSERKVEPQQIIGLTDFECSNLIKLHQFSQNAASGILLSRDTMLQNFAAAQQLVDGIPSSARAHALHILSKVPSIAEKRSRVLVPMFLLWANKDGDQDDEDVNPDEQGGEVANTYSSNWTRKDQKSLLELFGKFSNSRSLVKSQEVYYALLRLLANGDLEIQRSSLKAIFAWKSSSIKPYEENLLNLLDEARFKDEIAILLQGQTLVQREHRGELMPVLLRTLYGRTISRRGIASGRQGSEARRLTVLRHLSTEDFGSFIEVALGDLKDANLIKDGEVQESLLEKPLMRVEKLTGFINMMEVVLKELGTKVEPFVPMVVEAVLYCLIYSSRQLDNASDKNEGKHPQGRLSRFKDVRQMGLKCLVLLFKNSASSDWSQYLNVIVQEVINPRLEHLPIESAEGVSGILRLFLAWSSSSRSVTFLENRMLCRIADCLTPPKTKPEVKLFALSIIKNLIKNGDGVTDVVLSPNVEHFLIQIGGLLQSQSQPTPELLESSIEVVSQLTPFINSSTQARTLVEISILLLERPRLNHRVKSNVLLILEHFVPLYNLQEDAQLQHRVYSTVTSLFSYFKDTPSRDVLSKVLKVYSKTDPMLVEVAELCMNLNAQKGGRLDEPDYERCSTTFTCIRDRKNPFTARQWMPLLHNMLYYIKDEEAFSIMSMGSSDAIKTFISNATEAEEGSPKVEFKDVILKIIIPALFSGVRGFWNKGEWKTSPETVRQEYVKIMGHLVKSFPTWSEVSDMHTLLASDDELESSFFNNILAVGKGKQSTALGQLSAAAESGVLGGKNVSQFFIPLIENFILDRAEGNDGHNLAAEATTTIGTLAGSLEWPQYRAMLRRFIGYLKDMPKLQKQIIKLLGRVIDALALAANLDPEERSILALTMPKELKLATDLTTNILPPLTEYLHDKDESSVSLRVPVAIIVVRLLKLLPQEQLTERLPPVLTDICHILRSKSQEARDMTRETLVEICVLLGPSCFGFVLKELRGALAKGYQLHVLSYTMHSILVETTPKYAPGDLDYCLPNIVAIIMDDIFGATGQEKDAEEYTSKMKEVKSSKSHDSMELIAKTATLSHLIHLVRPIQALLKEKLNIKIVRKIDDLLSRISAGLLRNHEAQSRDSLIFCYEVIQDATKPASSQVKNKVDLRLKKYLVLKDAKKSGERGSTTIYMYKLVRFGFDVLRAVVKKYENLRTSSNLAQFIPMVANATVEAEEEVRISVFRLLASIAKVSLKGAIDGPVLYRIASEEATRCISQSTSTSSNIAQASLHLLSVVLRDCHDVVVKDTALDTILTKLKDDITQPERRHVTFKFLRAVLDSKVQTAVVYDTLDYVREVMVTNDDKDTRDLARGSYVQFLREYQQKKIRWTKQLDFLTGNVTYSREGGRLQILEVVHLLLSKLSDEYVQEVAARFFPHLVLVIANDDSEKCRILAGELVKEIFGKADKEQTAIFLKVLRPLVERGETRTMVPAFRIYGYYYEVQASDKSDIPMLLESVYSTIAEISDNSDIERTLAALELSAVLMIAFPEMMMSPDASRIWTVVTKCISYPNARVKQSAAKQVRAYLVDFAQSNASSGFVGLPLKGSRGLELTGDNINDLIRRSANIFKTPELRMELAQEATQILSFLGTVAGANNLLFNPHQEQDEDSESEDEERWQKRSSLQYLFGRLSYTLRQETSPPRAPALIPKTVTLNLFKVLCSRLPMSSLLPSLDKILLPLYNLTDTSIPTPYSTDEQFKSDYETLRADSQALMESLREIFGVEVFSSTLQSVRDGVRNRRMARTTKRRIEAVAMPERHGEQKRKKGERKRKRRKEKGQEHSQRRKEMM